jgi:DNA-binding CsgD family transcriptional regulator
VDINKATGNYTWLATNYYNIGYGYIQLGDYTDGLKYLKESERLAEEQNISHLYPYIWGAYGTYYYENGNYGLALEFGHKSYAASKQRMNRLEERFALNLITDIQVRTGHMDSAYFYQKAVVALNDSIYRENSANQLDFLEMKYQFQEELAQHQLEIELLEAEMEKRRIRRNYIIVIVLLMLIAIVVIVRNRFRRKTLEQENLLLEKRGLSDQIEYKNKELATNLLYLLNRNELIASLERKISSMRFDGDDPNKMIYNDILAELKKTLTQKTWKEFEVRFNEVHNDFYHRLNRQFPDLSPNERRLCAFLKLNMTTKEISSITFQSADSLKMARHRLRKKLGLKRDDNLVAFLNSI